MTTSNTNFPLPSRPGTRKHQRSWLAGVCLLLTGPPCFANGLTLEQEAKARSVASIVNWQGSVSPRSLHPLGIQTLSVEKPERKGQIDVRQVHVYQYHYAHRSARLLVIDLDTGAVQNQRAIDSVHLPLNDVEIAFSRTLVRQDPQIMQMLQQEQSLRGAALSPSLDELDVKASIFEPMDSQHPCANERCALLSLFDNTRTVFAAEPVVLLDTLQVQLLEQP